MQRVGFFIVLNFDHHSDICSVIRDLKYLPIELISFIASTLQGGGNKTS